MAILKEEKTSSSAYDEYALSESELKTLNFNVKSNNYLVRSYIATESKSKGGYLAIESDP